LSVISQEIAEINNNKKKERDFPLCVSEFVEHGGFIVNRQKQKKGNTLYA
jgi:hypothetical protein